MYDEFQSARIYLLEQGPMPLQHYFQLLFDASPNAYEFPEDDWNLWFAECTSQMREWRLRLKSSQEWSFS